MLIQNFTRCSNILQDRIVKSYSIQLHSTGSYCGILFNLVGFCRKLLCNYDILLDPVGLYMIILRDSTGSSRILQDPVEFYWIK